MGVLKKLVFSLITLVIVLGSIEGGLRASGWPPIEGKFDHNEPFWTTDANLDQLEMPHREEQTTFTVTTDANGLRSPIHSGPKEPGVFRVMTMGCSTTFGWGSTDAESYPAILESLLRDDGHTSVEVINAGQPGHTSFQGLWFWDNVLHEYDPDVVLVGYIVQDARRSAYTDRSQAILQQDRRFLKDHLLYNSRVYLGLRSLMGQVQIRAKERTASTESGTYRVPPENYVENLRSLVDRIQNIGAVPVLFGFPLERSGYTTQHRTLLQAAAETLDIAHFDPQPAMEQASQSHQLYFTNDRGHANPTGNALIANWVKGFLSSQGLLDN